MYAIVLAIHSFMRWLVVISLLFAVYRAYSGWINKKTFTLFDDKVRHVTATIIHIQLLAGLYLYSISPLIRYFLSNFSEAVRQREIRFFGMEHSTMMLVSVFIISIGSAMAKRRQTDRQKFKTMALWFTAGFVLILLSIPWKFSPMASRPYFRMF